MILPGLSTRKLGRHFLHLEEVDSTNNYLKEHADGLPHGAAVLADYQSRGKGRMGKSWSDKKGGSLAFSVLLREEISQQDMTLLPLLTGLAVCLALEDLGGAGFSIKWSNDVLHGEKKLCGILCESRVMGSSLFAVLGIGVNLMQTGEDFSRLDLVYATSMLLATGRQFTEEETAAAVLGRLEPVLERYHAGGFDMVKDDYKCRCVTLGRQVRVLRGEEQVEAFARDIASDGSLVCTGADGKDFLVRAGEASVRGLYGYV